MGGYDLIIPIISSLNGPNNSRRFSQKIEYLIHQLISILPLTSPSQIQMDQIQAGLGASKLVIMIYLDDMDQTRISK